MTDVICGVKGKHRNKIWKIMLAAVCGSILLLCFVGSVYVSDYYHADKDALEALEGDGAVTVEQIRDDRIVFAPARPVAGMIFYPGGKVEYTAYAPLLHYMAEQGVLCVLVRMPFNLAVLDIDAADGIQEEFPEVEGWYIGGHSLGGSMAASYAAEHAEDYKGLILLAAYAAEDIRQSGLRVMSVYGDKDGVLDMEKYMGNLKNLPGDMEEHIIEGGCHAQFGSYGLQKGDGIPQISGKEQREMTAGLIMEWIGQD